VIFLTCRLCEATIKLDCYEDTLPPVECLGQDPEDPVGGGAESHGPMVLWEER
jgi:hypothetical protein